MHVGETFYSIISTIQWKMAVDGKPRGSQDCRFKCLLRDTLHISGKSERSQFSEEVGNLFNSTNLPDAL